MGKEKDIEQLPEMADNSLSASSHTDDGVVGRVAASIRSFFSSSFTTSHSASSLTSDRENSSSSFTPDKIASDVAESESFQAKLNYFNGDELAARVWVRMDSTNIYPAFTLSAFEVLRSYLDSCITSHSSQDNRYLQSRMFRRLTNKAKQQSKHSFPNIKAGYSTYEMPSSAFEGKNIGYEVPSNVFGSTNAGYEMLSLMEEGSNLHYNPHFDIEKSSSYLFGMHFSIEEDISSLLWGDFFSAEESLPEFDRLFDDNISFSSPSTTDIYTNNSSYTHPWIFPDLEAVALKEQKHHLDFYLAILYRGVTVQKVAGRAPPFI
ncbi:MAG: hypothetical protein Q8909_13930 [Bacteroidota bacterium]|nr:hypothetical protein [Bacteroidota bacterium]